MLIKKEKTYDFTFVLPSFSLLPGGGYMVVFELSRHLSEKGYSVLIIFLKNVNKNLYKLQKEKELKEKIQMTPFKYKIYDYFQNTMSTRLLISIIEKHPSYLKITGIKLGVDLASHSAGTFFSEFNFDKIDFLVIRGIPEKLKTRRIVATAWETSYFVNRFQGCKHKYYLAQHDEDDPSYSGQLENLARRSYSLVLKKIVINKRMQERFSAENPIKINVAAHVKGKVSIKPEYRSNKIILMQIRESADKGAQYAIEAAKLIKSKRPDVEFVSFGNYKQHLPAFIKNLGYLSDSKYIDFFNLATIFVLPSLVEGFSTPVLEAMSCGCVPVATKCGGPENFVEHKKNGILVSIKNSQEIANGVIWLLENKEERIQMAYRAIDTSENFSIDRMGNEFIDEILKYEQGNA